jgi:hypothetical protein
MLRDGTEYKVILISFKAKIAEVTILVACKEVE